MPPRRWAALGCQASTAVCALVCLLERLLATQQRTTGSLLPHPSYPPSLSRRPSTPVSGLPLAGFTIASHASCCTMPCLGLPPLGTLQHVKACLWACCHNIWAHPKQVHTSTARAGFSRAGHNTATRVRYLRDAGLVTWVSELTCVYPRQSTRGKQRKCKPCKTTLICAGP